MFSSVATDFGSWTITVILPIFYFKLQNYTGSVTDSCFTGDPIIGDHTHVSR